MKTSSSQRQGQPVIHERAAGIDIGSRFHVVAVPVDLAEEPVQTFKAYRRPGAHGRLAGRAGSHHGGDGVDRGVLDSGLRDSREPRVLPHFQGQAFREVQPCGKKRYHSHLTPSSKACCSL